MGNRVTDRRAHSYSEIIKKASEVNPEAYRKHQEFEELTHWISNAMTDTDKTILSRN